MLIPRSNLLGFILLTSCFAWWGLANNMTDTLLAAFKRIMSMTDFQTSWIQLAFYGSYFCLALPAAMFIKKFTYKAGVLLGLGLFVTGALLFYPASRTMNYFHFLGGAVHPGRGIVGARDVGEPLHHRDGPGGVRRPTTQLRAVVQSDRLDHRGAVEQMVHPLAAQPGQRRGARRDEPGATAPDSSRRTQRR